MLVDVESDTSIYEIAKESISTEDTDEVLDFEEEGKNTDWKTPLMTKVPEEKIPKTKKVSQFYHKQNALVDVFSNVEKEVAEKAQEEEDIKAGIVKPKPVQPRVVTAAIVTSFVINILLFIFKLWAAIQSKSLAVIASAMDSFLDLLSGSIIFITNRIQRKRNPYKYPAGNSRMEPLGIVVFASVMFTATLQLIIAAVQTMLDIENFEIDLSVMPLTIISLTIVLKLGLWIFCGIVYKRTGNESVHALAADHRNDVISNTVGVAAACVAFYYWIWADPIGAILIGLYIMFVWAKNGIAQLKILSGKSADPEFLSKVTYLAWNHHPSISHIDTVKAYHLAYKYILEVDIVLPEDMPLKEAHDIGESLQFKLAKLDEVERCFVHLDYETEHKPEQPS